MDAVKMKVVKMDYSVLKHYINGCVQQIKEQEKEETWLQGHSRGIEDALKIIEEKDLTFVMKMATLGLKHSVDKHNVEDNYYTKPDALSYFTGYRLGLTYALQIITGEPFDKLLDSINLKY